MSDSIFREGGPLNIKRIGPDRHTMSVSVPRDENGRIARECPDEQCSPGYFKVRPGTGITSDQQEAFCPYCRRVAGPSDFVTKEQIRYAKDLAIREAREGVERLLRKSLKLDGAGRRKFGGGLISLEMQLKPGAKPMVRWPAEDQVRRDVVCPACGLDQSVFGLATWCADCGRDIFLTHMDAELAVLRSMLGDVSRRREMLGIRVATKDLENALEDVVSIFEAVLRIVVRRTLLNRGASTEEATKQLKRAGNGLQNVQVANRFVSDQFGIDGLGEATPEDLERLDRIFAKRHPITHNLGVVDRKYLERVRSAEEEGREIVVSEQEVACAIDLTEHLLGTLYRRLLPD